MLRAEETPINQFIIPTNASSGLQLYDPEKGLLALAAAEAAHKHFARAKNLDGLSRAIEAKLKEQRNFILWWDRMGEKRGSGPSQRCRRSETSLPIAGRNGLPDRRVLHRWRQLLDPRIFAATLAAAKEKARALCEGDRNPPVTLNTGEIEWYTPPEYLERVRAVLGSIDLDPASTKVAQKTVKANRYFTKVEDALNREWHGRIFMNPPYDRDLLPRFVEKLIGEFRAGRVCEAIVLVHSLTDPSWFHDLAGCASAICFTRGRIPFVSPYGEANAPVHGSAFFYLGPCRAKFIEEFGAIGLVVLPVVGA